MKKELISRVTAAAALTMAAGLVPAEAGLFHVPGLSITASAAGGNISYNSDTRVLTLSGDLSASTADSFLSYASKADKIVANSGTVMPANCYGLFKDFKALETVVLTGAKFTSTTTMTDMFKGCSEMTSIKFDPDSQTSSCTAMDGMFYGCSALTSINLNGLDTKNVGQFSSISEPAPLLRH